MQEQTIHHAREVPSPHALRSTAGIDAAREPVLELDQIQGNVIPGFSKSHETLLFLRIVDVSYCKRWLKEITPLIATAEEVLSFNRLYKALRTRRGYATVQATWVNIAFSYGALQRLTAGTPAELRDGNDFLDPAFREGMASRADVLGDPLIPDAEGNPARWLIGGPGNEAEILLIIQSDSAEELRETVISIKSRLAGVTVMLTQYGANLPQELAGHEHFKFLDGVSQPGVRGRASAHPDDVITPRQDPRDPNHGKPGQQLIWPGEFVFGYPYQDPAKPVNEPSDSASSTTTANPRNEREQLPVHRGAISEAGPSWGRNGSFLVFRRLRQDVGRFHAFLNEQARQQGISPALMGAKVVGRWLSGAPLSRSANEDAPDLANNECANNDFRFFHADPVLTGGAQPPDTLSPRCGGCAAPGTFEPAPADRQGGLCPFISHIRKGYPRDSLTKAGHDLCPNCSDEEKSAVSERDTQRRRILRRGLPYGPVSPSTLEHPLRDLHDEPVNLARPADRGLLFVCYQTSIIGQFEFLTHFWFNNPDFPEKGEGLDLVIGQHNGPNGERLRQARVPLKGGVVSLVTAQEWVIPTGGGYFFAPSLDALKLLFAGS